MRLSLLIAALVVAVPTSFAQSADLAPDSRRVGKPAPSTTVNTWNPYLGGPTLLFDQLQLENVPGSGESVLQNASLGMSSLGAGQQFNSGNFIADDFVVPPGQVWTITEMNFFGYQTGADPETSTFTSYVAQIWDGSPDSPASSVIAGDLTTDVLTSSEFSEIFRLSETSAGNTDRPIFRNTVMLGAPVELQPGTYWVQWSATGSLASGPWQPPVTIDGETTTGNALQQVGGTWREFLDGDPVAGTGTLTPQGAPFQILGSTADAVGPILSFSPSGVDFGSVEPGMSASQTITLTSSGNESVVISSIAITGSPEFTVDQTGTELTLAPGESTTFDIAFAPTAVGAFSADVEISSNDPDGQIVIEASGSSDVTTTFDASNTDGQPFFARPDDLGTGTSGSCTLSTDGSMVSYEATDFVISDDGDYDVRADWTGGQDGYLLLYSAGAFDPADPCVGLIALNDDAGSIAASQLNGVTLSSSATYTAVATGFDNGASGAYVLSVTGPGTASLAVANEQTGAFDSGLSVSPNPASDRATVSLGVATTETVSVSVFDVTGRRVATLHDGAAVAGQTLRLSLDTASLPSGVYVVRAISGADVSAQRVTVIR